MSFLLDQLLCYQFKKGQKTMCSRPSYYSLIVAGLILFSHGRFEVVAKSDAPEASATHSTSTNYASPQRRWRPRNPDGVYKAFIEPHWLADSDRFWYRNELADGRREYVLVDAGANEQGPAFDHQKLAKGLSAATGDEHNAEKLELSDLEFSTDTSAMRFLADETRFSCDLDSYECTEWNKDDAEERNEVADDARGRRWPRNRRSRTDGDDETDRSTTPSPDDKWVAFVRDHNVYVRPNEEDAAATQLSDDGSDQHSYRMLQWSPDSESLVAFRVTPGDDKEVYRIESSPRGGGRAKLQTSVYPLPGDRLTAFELNLFNPNTGKHIKPEVDVIDLGWPSVEWRPDDRHFSLMKVDRGHQRLRVFRVDSHTGDTVVLVDEQADTFIWTAHTENLDLRLVNWLDDSEELIYVSEMDGWRHLYLIDGESGGIKNPITTGDFVVRGVDWIDAENRQVWFTASGGHEGQDPYFLHYYRVDFDGSNLVLLTEGNGTHRVQFSPDRKYLIDTYSRVDAPPVHELRRSSDGSLIRQLEVADISELTESGWQPLEVFHTTGRDGVTEIWGVISLPKDFDPEKTYPVLESVYAGPQGSYVPKGFSASNRYASMTDLGFVVVQVDGMGTANRSKEFHDMCWHNLKDAGFPDRIKWIKSAAADRPYMDLDRVGIYGASAGGQNAAGGVLFHSDFYKAAAAGCGCHDNRMDKSSWNEQWMGYPVGPHYAKSSNIDNAKLLEGKLLLIVGELDNNVPPESTLRFVDALIKAEKDFEFEFVPGEGHGYGGSYGYSQMQNFFVRHLIDGYKSRDDAHDDDDSQSEEDQADRSRPAEANSQSRPATADVG